MSKDTRKLPIVALGGVLCVYGAFLLVDAAHFWWYMGPHLFREHFHPR